MRILPAALIILGLLSSPALPQSPDGALSTPVPTEAAQRALWCGAAFQILATTTAGNAAQDYEGMAQRAFTRAARELIPQGMTVEQFRRLAEEAARTVTAPFRQESYTEAECRAAVSATQ